MFLRPKERAPPRESPKVRKKVIRAPAVSASLGLTSLDKEKNRILRYIVWDNVLVCSGGQLDEKTRNDDITV